MRERLVIDGAHGEGGGQIVRSALTLSAITGRAIELTDIRAGRPKPGLAAQHLTAVRAAAMLCGARLTGDALGSESLAFAPGGPVRGGDYVFDVAAAREGGSAGAASLVLQTVLLPLALAPGRSSVLVHGGTHVPWSPPFDYLRDVWLPVLGRLGIAAAVTLRAWGWYPAGRGAIYAAIDGLGAGGPGALRPLEVVERGALRGVRGLAVAANLPSHIPQRMADRARALLGALDCEVRIEPRRVRAASAGAGLFLVADYEGVPAGFSAFGAPGKPSEAVAEEAVAALEAHRRSGAALDVHLGDQLVLPLALAQGPSTVSVERASRHLETCLWLVAQFGLARAEVERGPGETALLRLSPGAGPAGT